MITQHNFRDNGGGEVLLGDPLQRGVEDAMEALVKYELGYGGVPTEITPTKVEVRTTVMGCKDRTVWTGPEVEMAPLVEIAAYVTVACQSHDSIVKNLVEPLQMSTCGNPLMVSLLAPFMLGKARLRVACVLCADREVSEEAVAKAQVLSLEDLCTAVLLARENNQSFLATCEQLAL